MKCPECESIRVDMIRREHRRCEKDPLFPIGVWYEWVYHWICDACGHKWEVK